MQRKLSTEERRGILDSAISDLVADEGERWSLRYWSQRPGAEQVEFYDDVEDILSDEVMGMVVVREDGGWFENALAYAVFGGFWWLWKRRGIDRQDKWYWVTVDEFGEVTRERA